MSMDSFANPVYPVHGNKKDKKKHEANTRHRLSFQRVYSRGVLARLNVLFY